MQKIRILFIHSQLGLGGAETELLDILRHIDRERFEPMLCYFRPSVGDSSILNDVVKVGLPMYLVDRVNLSVPKFMWQLIGVIRQTRPDVINTWGVRGNPVGQLAALLAGQRRVVSLDFHNGLAGGWRARLAEMLLCRLDAGRIAVSYAVADTYASVLHMDRRRINVVRSGIDTDRFIPLPPDEALRAELGIPQDWRIVTMVARLTVYKNHRMLIRAAERVCQRLPKTVFLVVGTMHEYDYGVKDAQGQPVPNIEVLRQMVAEAGIEQNVKFLGPRRDVPEILSITDVFTMTSETEALNNAVLEAMAAERPVVATAVGGMKELILPGQTGYYADHDDDAVLAERLVELLEDEPKRLAFGKAARRAILEEFTLPIMIQRKSDIYARAAQSRFSWLRLLTRGYAHRRAQQNP